MGAIRICYDFFSRSIPSFQRHSIAKETITVLEAVILESFSSSRIIPVIQSGKSLHPTPSAEGGGWSDFSLWMTGMIRNEENDYGMTDCVRNDNPK